jgi:hypothetical protein
VERVTYCLGIGYFIPDGKRRFEPAIVNSHWVPLNEFFLGILGGPTRRIDVGGRLYAITDGFTLTGALLAMRRTLATFPALHDTIWLQEEDDA